MKSKYLLEVFGSENDELQNVNPTQAVLDASQIIEAIDSAHRDGQVIRIHAIGPCVLDWTKGKKIPHGNVG